MKDTTIVDETIVWNKVENKMSTTAEDAPYLGVVQVKDTITFDKLVSLIKAEGCSENELEIKRFLTKAAELLKSYVAQNYKVYTPFGLAGVHITKSFTAADAAFDANTNEAIMGILTNEEVRECLDGVTLKEDKEAAAVLAGPKINSVCTGGTRFSEIVGTTPFVIAGSGLDLDSTKATDVVTLINKAGVETNASSYTVDGEGFRVTAQMGTALAAGDYTLQVSKNEGSTTEPKIVSATLKGKVVAA